LAVRALDEVREPLVRLRETERLERIGYHHVRTLVVVVVCAERNYDPSRDMVGKEVLELAQVRPFGAAEPTRVTPPNLREVDRQILREVDLGAIDVEARTAAKEAAVG